MQSPSYKFNLLSGIFMCGMKYGPNETIFRITHMMAGKLLIQHLKKKVLDFIKWVLLLLKLLKKEKYMLGMIQGLFSPRLMLIM